MIRNVFRPRTLPPGCREVVRQLQAYLDAEVDDVSTRRIAAHLELCRDCGMDAQTYSEIKASLARRGARTDRLALQRLRGFADDLASGLIPLTDDGP